MGMLTLQGWLLGPSWADRVVMEWCDRVLTCPALLPTFHPASMSKLSGGRTANVQQVSASPTCLLNVLSTHSPHRLAHVFAHVAFYQSHLLNYRGWHLPTHACRCLPSHAYCSLPPHARHRLSSCATKHKAHRNGAVGPLSLCLQQPHSGEHAGRLVFLPGPHGKLWLHL